jgi:hypothetical protein
LPFWRSADGELLLLFNGYRIFVLDDEKVLGNNGDGSTTLGMYLLPINCML